MSGPAGDYLALSKALNELIDARSYGSDPTVRAYMLARAALVRVKAVHGNERAAQLAYRLGDEFTTGDPV